ncbi:uncharacterized protein LOC130898016 [Diorhabda carinulata]|uniref:uncharacterized protein LOC130898016 n=1 Tax=Diorhabda carinulata TaxID=1163345 RepID=UPI0025A0098D|nr:uncharacterized protein LOC130898016 [Diorhabda carinulata]
MASEAERLIGISLTKIAQSRSHRGGVSLHKNLLVATVLQKARYIFMEEAYNMVHYRPPAPVQSRSNLPHEELVGLTAEEACLEANSSSDTIQESSASELIQQPTCVKCSENQDKENHPPYNSELTYLDLDKSSNVLRERSNSPSLKRRRAVAEWETEEAVQSILPKKSKQDDDSDDSVFLDDATLLSDAVSKEIDADRQQQQQENNDGGSSMEIDRITSLVSIFSFSMGDGKLNRSMSTPDLCSTQAKDNPDTLQQRQFIAMTV